VFQQQQSWTGEIEKAGADYILRVKDNAYALQGARRDVENLWGHGVEVQGWLNGQTIEISTIEPASGGEGLTGARP
jgi:hypothetical protein